MSSSRTSTLPASPSFGELGVSVPLIAALDRAGVTQPFAVQAATLPDAIAGRDVLVRAQTGSGKTLAFGLAAITRLEGIPAVPMEPLALILVPTRELAMQVNDGLSPLVDAVGLRIRLVAGGMPYRKQVDAIRRGVHIVVATPGRLMDLVSQGAVDLSRVRITVLDEADQMLDLGFIHALKRVHNLLPKKRQSLFFSATMPKPIRELAARFLHDPVEVAVAPVATAAETVDQAVIMTRGERKPALLAHVLSNHDDRAIVFTRTKHGADKVVRGLAGAGIDVFAQEPPPA